MLLGGNCATVNLVFEDADGIVEGLVAIDIPDTYEAADTTFGGEGIEWAIGVHEAAGTGTTVSFEAKPRAF